MDGLGGIANPWPMQMISEAMPSGSTGSTYNPLPEYASAAIPTGAVGMPTPEPLSGALPPATPMAPATTGHSWGTPGQVAPPQQDLSAMINDLLHNIAQSQPIATQYSSQMQQFSHGGEVRSFRKGGRTYDSNTDPLAQMVSGMRSQDQVKQAILTSPSIMRQYDVQSELPDAPTPQRKPRVPGVVDPEDLGDTLSQYDTPLGQHYLHDLATMQHKAKGGLIVNTNPSDGQKHAGNYRKGHVKLHGLHISIENPKGTERKGKGKDGKEWKVRMPAHYGYIKRTEGADGDHVDVSVGDHHDVDHVHVIDQIDPDTRKFDEHKAMLGFKSAGDAVRAYRSSFSDGRGHQRIGAVTPMHVGKFREWVKTRHARTPLGSNFKKTPKSVIAKFASGGFIDDASIDALRGGPNG